MRFFNWKTAIVSLVIFIVPVFFYPVCGTMANEVTTYSYGFPSSWLSVQFDAQGGRLFGFELFGANIVGINISILTALLDLLVIYLVVTAFVKVFWVNHFSLKYTNWKEKRRCQKEGILLEAIEPNRETLWEEYDTISTVNENGLEINDNVSVVEQIVMESFQENTYKDGLPPKLLGELEKDKTA